MTLGLRLLRGYVGDLGPFGRFRAALNTIATSPVNILATGDSITLGSKAATTGDRWLEVLGRSLVSSYDPSRSLAVEYAPVWPTSVPFSNPWVNTGSPTVNLHFGPGRGAGNLTAGKTMQYTFTGTGFDLYYAQGPSGSGFGEFSYAVDGGAPTTVDARDATMLGSRRVRVTGLASASHTIDLAPVSASVPIEGITGYAGTETSGIRAWNGGHGTYTSAEFADPAEPHWLDILDTVLPTLYIIELGTNDCVLGSPTAAQFRTNVETIIANVRARCAVEPAILLVALYQALGRTNWVDYVTAMQDLVAADGQAQLFSLVPYFGGYVDVPAGVYIDADRIHPTSAGHAYIAGLIQTALGV